MLLHILGHGLVKSVLFLGAGRILQITGTSRIDRVRGLAARQPVLAGCFGLGVLALIGLPPFSLFASELGHRPGRVRQAGLGLGDGGRAAARASSSPPRSSATPAGCCSAPPPGSGSRGAAVDGDDRRRCPARAAVALDRRALVAACAALGVTTGPLSGAARHAAADILRR